MRNQSNKEGLFLNAITIEDYTKPSEQEIQRVAELDKLVNKVNEFLPEYQGKQEQLKEAILEVVVYCQDNDSKIRYEKHMRYFEDIAKESKSEKA